MKGLVAGSPEVARARLLLFACAKKVSIVESNVFKNTLQYVVCTWHPGVGGGPHRAGGHSHGPSLILETKITLKCIVDFVGIYIAVDMCTLKALGFT